MIPPKKATALLKEDTPSCPISITDPLATDTLKIPGTISLHHLFSKLFLHPGMQLQPPGFKSHRAAACHRLL